MSDGQTRIIKRYSNRRIYDTHESRYITLLHVRGMVVEGVDFKIIDAKTGEDRTRLVLLQIIIEQESDRNPLFTTDSLQNFIRGCGASQHQGFSEFINQSVQFFRRQQEQFSSGVADMMEQNPAKAFADLSRQNMEMWQQMQGAFFGQPRSGKDSGKNSGKDSKDSQE